MSGRVGERQSPSPTQQPHMRSSYAHHQRRDSDTVRSVAQTSSGSPTAVDNPRSSPPNRAYSNMNGRHRRSPTAPEISTTSGSIAPSKDGAGNNWASGERDPYGSDFDGAEKNAPPAVQQQQQPRQQQQPQPAPATQQGFSEIRNRSLIVRYITFLGFDTYAMSFR